MLLPHEPLIKIVHSRIKCYNHKTQKKNKNGELHTYITKQYMVPLKIDQPFSCEEEISVCCGVIQFFRIHWSKINNFTIIH